jgi:hypothetical protein
MERHGRGDNSFSTRRRGTGFGEGAKAAGWWLDFAKTGRVFWRYEEASRPRIRIVSVAEADMA